MTPTLAQNKKQGVSIEIRSVVKNGAHARKSPDGKSRIVPVNFQFICNGTDAGRFSDLEAVLETVFNDGSRNRVPKGIKDGTSNTLREERIELPAPEGVLARDFTLNASSATSFGLLLPSDGVTIPANQPIDFAWATGPQATFYRLEIEDENDKPILSAMLKSAVRNYRAPSWLKSKITSGSLRWRVVALDRAGQYIGETERRKFQITR